MKKALRLISLLIALLLAAMPLTAFAASVEYEGGAEKFVFITDSEYNPTDLFENFKGAMPGDVLTGRVTVENNDDSLDYVKIYLKAIAHDEEENPLSDEVVKAGETVATMEDFLSQLHMTVYNGAELIFEASPDELDGLSEFVLLGEFDYGESTQLVIQLEVPAELGNEYAYRTGEVDWVFAVEEFEKPVPEDGKTGDESNIWLYIGILVLAVVLIIIIIILLKKKKQEDEEE